MVIIRTVLKKFFRFLSVCGGNRCDFAPLQWGCVRTELGMRCSLAIRCRTSRPLRDDTEVQIAATAWKVCRVWIPPTWYDLTRDRTVVSVHLVALATSERQKPIAVKCLYLHPDPQMQVMKSFIAKRLDFVSGPSQLPHGFSIVEKATG